ncbi:MAG: hypothetical protein JJT82_10610 [Legionellaceae bacterium]|nr:hypothetical protein [Legionellaceae bacterium]
MEYSALLIGAILMMAAAFLVLKPLGYQWWRLAILIPLLSTVIMAMYWQFGSFSAYLAFRHAQEQEQQIMTLLQSNPGREQLMTAIERKLSHDPHNAKGWYLLGRLSAGGEDWQKAQQSFARAREIDPQDIAIQVNYAQSLWQANQQQFTQEIRSIFQAVLKQKSRQPDALSMLAIDAYQRQSYTEAIQYWEQLLTVVMPGSKDADAVRQAIAEAQKHLS